MNIIKRFFVGFFVLGLSFFYAQNSYALTSGPLTPEVASFATVNLDGDYVDLATGDLQLNFPIITVPGRGNLDFALSLQYTAGIKTNQEASWTGLGFNINPGAIYRTTSYIPDDYKNKSAWSRKHGEGSSVTFGAFGLGYTSSHSGGRNDSGFSMSFSKNPLSMFFGWSKWKYHYDKDWNVWGFAHFQDNASKAGWDYYCTVECFRREYQNNGLEWQNIAYAPSPPMDSYTVAGPGPQGELQAWRPNYQLRGYYTQQDGWANNDTTITGEMKLFFNNHLGTTSGNNPIDSTSNESAVKVDYVTSATTGRIESITITDIDGKKYIYGQPALIMNSGVWAQYDSSNYTKFGINDPYAYAWYLTEILSSDYVDSDGQPGPTTNDRGKYVKFNYSVATNDYVYSDPYTSWREAPFIHENDKYVRNWGKKELVYLSEIITPTHKAVFSISDRLDARESNASSGSAGTAAGGTEHPKKLDSITLYSIDPSNGSITGTATKVDFDYDYSLRPGCVNSDASGALTLKTVTKNSSAASPEIYNFEYNGINPSWGTYKWDRWGFYKSNGAWGVHAAVNQGETQAWSLTDITYPTGGTLNIEYETDTFTLGSTPFTGGGLRVSDLNFDDKIGNTVTKKYTYENGTVGNNPPPPYESTSSIYKLHPFSSGEIIYKKTTYIPVYSQGQNTFGSVETEFTTADDYHSWSDTSLSPSAYDGGIVNYWGNIVNGVSGWDIPYYSSRGKHVTAIYDRDYALKIPKSRKVFSTSGALIEHTTYQFTESQKRDGFVFHNNLGIVENSDYLIDFYLWGKIDVTEKTVYKDNVYKHFDYTYYNNNGQIADTIETDALGNTTFKSVSYCTKLNNCGSGFGGKVGEVLEARNMIALPFSETTREGSASNPIILKYNYTNYSLKEDGETDYSRMRLYHKATLDWKDNGGNGTVDWSMDPIPDDYLGVSNEDYDQFGNVTAKKDLLNTTTYFTYDRAGSVVKSMSKSGHTTEYFYDDPRFNLPTKIIFPDSTQELFSYDEFGRLSSATSTNGLQTTHTYTFAGSAISPSNLNKINTERTIDGDTRITVNYHDGLGRQVMIAENTDDSQWILTQKEYNELGKLSKVHAPFKSSSDLYGQESPFGHSLTTYQPEPTGRVKDEYPNYIKKPALKTSTSYSNVSNHTFVKDITDPEGINTQIQERSFGLINTTVREGRSTTTNRDFFGNVTTVTDTAGKTTKFFYDTFNRKIATRRHDMKAFTSVSHSWLGTVTEEWEYNYAGLPVLFRDANLFNSTDDSDNPEPKHITYYYDSFGRLTTKEIRRDSDNAYIQDSRLNYAYDTYPTGWPSWPSQWNAPYRSDLTDWQNKAKGKLTAISGLGQAEVFFYNDSGMLAEKHVLIDNVDYKFEYDYNIAEELTRKTIDPVNNIDLIYEYGTEGHIIFVKLKKENLPTLQIAEFTYNADGTVDNIIRANGVTSNFDYNSLRKLELIQTAGLSSTAGFDRFFKYDSMGRITWIYKGLDENSPILANYSSSESYDEYGQLKKGTINSTIGSKTRDLTFDYDNSGNRTYRKEAYNKRVCRWVYIEQEDAIKNDVFLKLGKTHPGGRYVCSYVYTTESEDNYEYLAGTNKLLSVTKKDGTKIGYMYDSNGNIVARGEGVHVGNDLPNQGFTPINDGYVNSEVVNDTGVSMTVGSGGLPESRAFIKFDVGELSQTPSSAILRIWGSGSTGMGDNIEIWALDSDYGTLGQEDFNAPGVLIDSIPGWEYDIIYLNVASYINSGVNAFMIKANGSSSRYYYETTETLNEENAPRLILRFDALDPFIDGDHESFAYDLYGHMTSTTLEEGSSEIYSYNSQDQRYKKTDSLGRSYVYIYNSNDVSFDRQTGGFIPGDMDGDGSVTTLDVTYLYRFIAVDGPAPEPIQLADTNGNGEIDIADAIYLNNYILGSGSAPIIPSGLSHETAYVSVSGVRLFAISQGNVDNVKYFLTDQIGSSGALIDQNGDDLGRQDYYPFGMTFASSGNVTKYQYTGKENDKTTGLYYYGSRFYDPATGRFMARDTKDDMFGMNQYAYVSNNPLIAMDPTGNGEEDAVFFYGDYGRYVTDPDTGTQTFERSSDGYAAENAANKAAAAWMEKHPDGSAKVVGIKNAEQYKKEVDGLIKDGEKYGMVALFGHMGSVDGFVVGGARMNMDLLPDSLTPETGDWHAMSWRNTQSGIISVYAYREMPGTHPDSSGVYIDTVFEVNSSGYSWPDVGTLVSDSGSMCFVGCWSDHGAKRFHDQYDRKAVGFTNKVSLLEEGAPALIHYIKNQTDSLPKSMSVYK